MIKLQTPVQILAVLDADREKLLDSVLNSIAEQLKNFSGSALKFNLFYSKSELDKIKLKLAQVLKESDWQIIIGDSFSSFRNESFTEVEIRPIETMVSISNNIKFT